MSFENFSIIYHNYRQNPSIRFWNHTKRSKHMLKNKFRFEIATKPHNIFEDFNNWRTM